MKLNHLIALAMIAASGATFAGTTDILNPPVMPTGGWGLAHNNIGQSFNAIASDVTIGVYVADQETYSQALQSWAATCTPNCGISAWNSSNVVSPTVSLNVTVYEGEGVNGKTIYQSPTPLVLTKPFNGIASIDLGAAGVFLTAGKQYTVIYNESTGTGTYWQFFSTIDRTPMVNPSTNQIDPNYNHGAYYGGWAYIQGVQQNPDSNIGDIAFQVIDNNPPTNAAPTACQGTSAITASTNVSKVFMTLANNQKVAYSNVYGSQGTTKFTYNGGIPFGTFPIGAVVTYTGVLDSTIICMPNSLTFDPAPVVVPPTPICTASQVLQGGVCVTPNPTCAAPAVFNSATNSCVTPATSSCVVPPKTKTVEGKAKITAVGLNSITVGSTVIFFDTCTIKSMNGTANFAIGQRAEYKGFSSNNIVTATKITIN